MLVEKLIELKNLILKRDAHDHDKDALDDCISQKVPKIFDERPDLDPNNEDDRNQAVAIAANICREGTKE